MVPRSALRGGERSSHWVPTALVAVAFVALALRLYALGYRVFYYDEAWFGYWTLVYLDTGVWEYRAILHGPFFARVNAVVFPALGVSDFTARLVVALIGGLLPLSAWLFREHLRDVEVFALSAVLAFNPILLYYSRFMRKDVPLAAFMLVALGLLVRSHDTGRARYLYGAALALGVAFATKESVLLWVLTWLGAGALLLDRRLLRARDLNPGTPGSADGTDGDGRVVAVVRSLGDRARRGLVTWAPHLAIAFVLFLAVVVFFYAPRSPGLDRPGLWKALGGEFTTLPAVIHVATVGSFERAVEHWVGGSKQNHPYLPYLADTLRTLGTGALGVSVLATLGFLHDRYTDEAPRDLVAFNFYAGVAAVLGYPLANNFPVPWSTVHAVVPLAVPAAVGAGVVVGWGRGRLTLSARAVGTDGGVPAWRRNLSASWPTIRGVLAVGLLVVLVVNSAAVAVDSSYANPHESPRGDPGSEVVYYAQAPAELRGGVDAIAAAAATGHDDVDVLYVGEPLAAAEGEPEHPTEIETGAWFARMPLPWYTKAAGADVASVGSAEEISDPPPVVIATPADRDAVAEQLGDGYAARVQPLDDVGDRTVVFFVRE